MKNLISALFVVFLAACSANEFVTSQPDQPRIILSGGLSSDVILIDQQKIGSIAQFQEPELSAIPVSVGKHTLQILRDGNVVHEETFYIDGNLTKNIDIR